MFFRGSSQSVRIIWKTSVIRVPDDLYVWIFQHTQVSGSVLCYGAAGVALRVNAGNGIIKQA